MGGARVLLWDFHVSRVQDSLARLLEARPSLFPHATGEVIAEMGRKEAGAGGPLPSAGEPFGSAGRDSDSACQAAEAGGLEQGLAQGRSTSAWGEGHLPARAQEGDQHVRIQLHDAVESALCLAWHAALSSAHFQSLQEHHGHRNQEVPEAWGQVAGKSGKAEACSGEARAVPSAQFQALKVHHGQCNQEVTGEARGGIAVKAGARTASADGAGAGQEVAGNAGTGAALAEGTGPRGTGAGGAGAGDGTEISQVDLCFTVLICGQGSALRGVGLTSSQVLAMLVVRSMNEHVHACSASTKPWYALSFAVARPWHALVFRVLNGFVELHFPCVRSWSTRTFLW